jgi:hypothetical protein
MKSSLIRLSKVLERLGDIASSNRVKSLTKISMPVRVLENFPDDLGFEDFGGWTLEEFHGASRNLPTNIIILQINFEKVFSDATIFNKFTNVFGFKPDSEYQAMGFKNDMSQEELKTAVSSLKSSGIPKDFWAHILFDKSGKGAFTNAKISKLIEAFPNVGSLISDKGYRPEDVAIFILGKLTSKDKVEELVKNRNPDILIRTPNFTMHDIMHLQGDSESDNKSNWMSGLLRALEDKIYLAYNIYDSQSLPLRSHLLKEVFNTYSRDGDEGGDIFQMMISKDKDKKAIDIFNIPDTIEFEGKNYELSPAGRLQVEKAFQEFDDQFNTWLEGGSPDVSLGIYQPQQWGNIDDISNDHAYSIKDPLMHSTNYGPPLQEYLGYAFIFP